MPDPRPWRTVGSAALTLLVLVAGASSSCRAADGPEPILAAARAAVADGRVTESRVLGFHGPNTPFTELPPQGAVLVGFDLGVGKFFKIETVYALRPVYRTAWGEIHFRDHGLFTDRRLPGNKVVKSKVVRTVRIRARPGYAVGGVTIRSGLNINGLAVTFMRINGRALDPQQSYTSAWVGDRTGGRESSIGGNGAPVVGVFGSEDEQHVKAVGLYFMNLPAPATAEPPAAPPRSEEPAEQPPRPPKVERPVELPRVPRPIEEPADPPPVKKPVAEPANPPQAERPAEPPPERAKPAVSAPPRRRANPVKEAPGTTAGTSWLPFVIFAAVAVPLFLLLLVSLGRKNQALGREHGPARPAPGPPAVPSAPVPPALAAICERPASGPGQQPRPAGEGILAALPAAPVPAEHAPGQEQDGSPGGDLRCAKSVLRPIQKPNWRAYHHAACDGVTVVSGDDYVLLECPFRPVTGTFCCGCRQFVPLDTVRWADSGELIAAYRKRVAAAVPLWRKVYLTLFATAYEGAVNWGVEWQGPPPENPGGPSPR